MLQRPGPSSQRQLPAAPYAGPDVYVNQQNVWQGHTYYRHGWNHPLEDDGFASRSAIQYTDTEPNPSVLQTPPTFSRPFATHRTHEEHLPQHSGGYHAPEESRELQHAPTEYATPPINNTAQYHASAQRSAPVAHILNYPLQPTGPIHLEPQPLMPLPQMSWHEPIADVPPIPHQYSQSHTSVALSSSGVISSSGNVSGLPWSNIDNGTAGAVLTTYERLPGIDHEWGPFVQPPPNDTRYSQPAHMSISQMSPTESTYSNHIGPLRQRGSRSLARPRQPKTKVASAYIPRQQKVKVSKRSGPLGESCKAKAHKMRSFNVCVRCKMYKAGCSDGDPCEKCAKTVGSARSFLQPCFRDPIKDTSLVRRCNGRFNQVEAEFLKYLWEDSGIFQIDAFWYLPGTQSPIRMSRPLRLRARAFHMEHTNPNAIKLTWKTTDDSLIDLRTPRYAIFDTAALLSDVETYFSENRHSMEQWIFERIGRDEIAELTYREVLRVRALGGMKTTRSILEFILQLQCLSIMAQGYGVVSSRNIPGIETVDFGALGHADYEAYDRNSRDQILPAAMNHQMDVAFLKILKRIEKESTKLLDEMVFKPKIKPWYELFLSFFMLFWHLEYVHQSATSYLKSKSGIMNPAAVKHQLNEWEKTTQTLLRYWSAILRQFVPFKIARENPTELREKGQLPDEEAFVYMMTMTKFLGRQGNDRYKPPLTGLSSSIYSLDNRWIKELLKTAGV